MKFFLKNYEIKDFQSLNSANLSYYHKLKDFHRKFGKKYIQIKIFEIFVSSLSILEKVQGQIFVGTMTP